MLDVVKKFDAVDATRVGTLNSHVHHSRSLQLLISRMI